MGDVKQFAVRSRVSPEGPRLERELFCRKHLTHSLQCIERFGADSCLLHALRSSSRDDSEEKTGETTHKHQRQASSQGSLNEHVSLPSFYKPSFPRETVVRYHERPKAGNVTLHRWE